MSISIMYGTKRKIHKMCISMRYRKITKFLSQLGMEKLQKVWKNRKNRKMHISIRYSKNVKIAKFLSQLGMQKTPKSQNVYLWTFLKLILLTGILMSNWAKFKFGVCPI